MRNKEKKMSKGYEGLIHKYKYYFHILANIQIHIASDKYILQQHRVKP